MAWKFSYFLIKKGYLSNTDYNKIENLRDKHKHKKAIICGNGPSVKIEYLEKFFYDDDYIIFCANRIHLIYDQTDFRPDYVFTSDKQVIEDFGEELIEKNKGKFFIISKTKPIVNDHYCWGFILNQRPFRFQRNVSKGFSSGAGSLFPAIQMAYFMGIKDMYLYGVDHSFSFKKQKDGKASGEGNHFIKNYRNNKKWVPPTYDLVEQAFKECDKFLRKNNGKLINSTDGGKLEVLERLSPSSLLDKGKPHEKV
ncbi:6-hydroxymethylpterin diphosphokinase MptE-like protein [Aquimarina aquimarini]|uniref:6-hydroxymethylpterin diphosphokinase MptE-like protein n=1 Tax=Aquimarina aquimarini TaxID=1191734 RepID=UPI00131ED9B7|nr:6-hydroxymethylpterin diphosphokinase MptE-like protein [Aquimarina aquimarini]